MFDEAPPVAPSPPPAPPPPQAPAGRYAYLVARLRNRQITMEEATELFSMQQGLLATATSRATAAASSADDSEPARSTTPSTAPTPTVGSIPGDDAFWMGLLAMGAGAGLLAAVLRRSRDGSASPPRTGATSAR